MHRLALIGASLLLAGACSSTTKTVTLEPNPQQRSTASSSASASAHASTAATLGVPPGHLPKAGECRVWIPGTPPGRQPAPKSRPCAGIASVAPAGSWVLYRPTDDKKLVHVREVDPHQMGKVVRIRIFNVDTKHLVREETP